MHDIPVSLGARSYRIVVDAGNTRPRRGRAQARLGVGAKVALFSDPGILARHGEPVRTSLSRRRASRSPSSSCRRARRQDPGGGRRGWDALLAAGLDRGSTVVALGGGAVGDLAGFVAATYMRGVNFVQIPTTLLAQVDASIGGKTAIDHPRAKNLIGAFHQPRLVLVDPAVLTTLPEREFAPASPRSIKHGIVLDAAYFADLETSRGPLLAREIDTLTRVVAGSCRLKAHVVERDEQEAELRAVLNYGHTIGHAVEAVTGYARWTHGEAVSLGIAAEARLAERLGLASASNDRAVRSTCSRRWACPCGTRARPPRPCSRRSVTTRSPANGRVPFVLAPEIGSFRVVFDVPREAVLETLRELG